MTDGKTGATESEAKKPSQKPKVRREIPGNFTYTTSPGVFEKVLKALRTAERPPTFSSDFMASVLNASGGSARAVPPILKRMQFLSPDGTPTELYAGFQSDGGKSKAALAGLKNAFPAIFKKNTYAHKLNQTQVQDIVTEITGLQKSDPVHKAISATFMTIKSFIENDFNDSPESTGDDGGEKDAPTDRPESPPVGGAANSGLGLSYHINIVLPESTDVTVYNAIFRSIKENLLK
jgi:hypothetical protein